MNERQPADKPLTVRCPTCGGPSVFTPANAFRPFCSERCKTLDLGAWASERYRVESQDTPAEDDGMAPPAAPH